MNDKKQAGHQPPEEEEWLTFDEMLSRRHILKFQRAKYKYAALFNFMLARYRYDYMLDDVGWKPLHGSGS